METSLHRQLKELYSDDDGCVEHRVGRFRIDVVAGGELIEIQHGSLAAIRDKVRRLLDAHRVKVVKPLIVRKSIVKMQSRRGRVIGRRMSPKRGGVLQLFDDLVYFTRVFPHPNLSVETPLVDIEEWRFPGHGRRRRWRRSDFQIADQKLVAVREIHRFRSPADLIRIVPAAGLPVPFHTQDLASALGVQRWVAQRIAYCWRNTGATQQIGKLGRARLYEFTATRPTANNAA